MKPCKHKDPLSGFGYSSAAIEAERLLRLGWKQKWCPHCKLWVIWEKPKALRESVKEGP